MLLGSQSFVVALQLQLLRLIPVVVLEAAALLTARSRPSRIGNYAPGVSTACRRAATPIT
jgi:hypothetical protein